MSWIFANAAYPTVNINNTHFPSRPSIINDSHWQEVLIQCHVVCIPSLAYARAAGLEETRKNVFRGERGPLPPIFDFFQPTRKRGGGSSPPKFLVPQQKLIANAPEKAAKHQNTPQNAKNDR